MEEKLETFPWLESLLAKAPMDLPAPEVEPEAYQIVLGCVPEHLTRLTRMAIQVERLCLEVKGAIDRRIDSPIILVGQMLKERSAEVEKFLEAQDAVSPAKGFLSTWLVHELKKHFELPAGTVVTIGKGWQVYAHRLEDEPKPAPKLVL